MKRMTKIVLSIAALAAITLASGLEMAKNCCPDGSCCKGGVCCKTKHHVK